MCCVLSNLNLCFWRLWNDPYNLVVVLCNFRSFDFYHTSFVLSKIVLTFELRFAMKTYRKRIASVSRKDFITDYQSRCSTDRSFTLPDNHLKNQLACYAFYAITQLAYLSQISNTYIYHVKKSWQKRKHAHNTRNDTQCSKKARLDRYYEDFDTIKIPQHKYTYIHTFVRER